MSGLGVACRHQVMSPRARVAVVKVETDIASAVRRAVELIGGLEGRVGAGDLVLVKPNFILAERSSVGTTTNLEVVRTVVTIFEQCGGHVVVGESSANLYDTKQVWAALSENSALNGYELRDLNDERAVAVDIPGAKALKRVGIAEVALKAQYRVSLPVMKTHVHTLITGGMKNMMGVLPLIEKWKMHTTNIHRAVTDLNRVMKPHLTVMDGTVAMEGMGPTWGQPVHMGLIIAGFDAVAVDAVEAVLMGVDPDEVKHVVMAEAAGLGCARLAEIEIVGESLDRVQKPFKRPKASRFFECYSKFQYTVASGILQATGIDIRPVLRKFVRFTLAKPRLVRARCESCQVCVAVCPVDAIHMRGAEPVIDYQICTRCMLCYEQCPKEAYQVARLPVWYMRLQRKWRGNRHDEESRSTRDDPLR